MVAVPVNVMAEPEQMELGVTEAVTAVGVVVMVTDGVYATVLPQPLVAVSV